MNLFTSNKIKRYFFYSLASIFALISFFIFTTSEVSAQSPVNLYLFYGDGCPHCAKEREFLSEIKVEYENRINVYEFEVYYDFDNVELFNQVTEKLNISVAGVPCLVIGDEEIVGYGSDDSSGEEIKGRIEYCLINNCSDPVYDIINPNGEEVDNQDDILGENASAVEQGSPIETEDENIQESYIQDANQDAGSNEVKEEETEIDIPFFGSVNLSKLSLPVATFLIALMDGFNPCAMWILIFLITMLINMKDKKRLYTLGSIFIITSALVYFVFLAAWFNFFKFIGYAYFIKVIIGIVAIASGILHLKSALFSKGECHAVNEEKRKSIIERIKKITKESSFILAVLGIVTLAVSVNIIEVVCSAGLPSIYTNLLASSDLSIIEHYGYLLFYTVIFMLDDLIIFFIAVKSFEVTGISSKYTKISSIVGGILILIIGILLIFKPELLMFG